MDVRVKVALRVGAVAVLTLALGYVLSLVNLALAHRRALQAEARLRSEVAALETSVPVLQTATFRFETDEGVERWAREHQKWAREGDQVIVPVQPTATPVGEPPPATPHVGIWERLLRWLRRN